MKLFGTLRSGGVLHRECKYGSQSTVPFAGIIVAMAVGCRFLIAQEARPATSESVPFTLQVSSREVILDVVVTDCSANLHNDLARDDFHITEDGGAQRIDGFEPPSAHMIPAASVTIRSTADLESRASQSPVNIIVLDELNTSFQDMAFARYALKSI
jgi:hypothetical protein